MLTGGTASQNIDIEVVKIILNIYNKNRIKR
jgi:hypothetical protein